MPTNPVLACSLLVVIFSLLIASTPARAFLFPYKRIHNASHEVTLTPEEWASELDDCQDVQNQTFGSPLPRECLHEQNSWLGKHNLEMWQAYKFLVQEDSLDERYANLVYGFNGRTSVYFHHYKIDTGDPGRDKLLLERQVVDARRVDDNLCKQHLRQMAALLDDLSWRVQRKREARRGGQLALTDKNASQQLQQQDLEQDSEDTSLDERHFRLGRVLDSFGRYESGHLNGRYHSFGMYDQCVRTQLKLAAVRGQGPLVDTRYCWARLGFDHHLNPRLRDRSAPDYNIGDMKFHLATCLPASCHSRSFVGDDENMALVQKMLNTQYKRPRAMWIDQSLPVESVFCLADEQSEVARMGQGGKLFLAFLASWFALCVFATYWRRDKHHAQQVLSDGRLVVPVVTSGPNDLKDPRRRRRESFWSHLDLWESWHEFLGTWDVSRDDDPVDLDTLAPIKTLSGGAVIVVHSILMLSPLNVNGLEMLAIMENSRAELLMCTGGLVIDGLFVLTGMLMTFVVLKRISKRRSASEYSPLSADFYKTWIYVTASRYFRLVPLYFLTFWFKKSVFNHLGAGPMWDYGLNQETLIGACRKESWLSPLTPMTAFTPLLGQCLPQSWSISNDLVFALVTPPFIILLYKHFRPTAVVIALTVLGSAWSGYYLVYLAIEPQYRYMLEQLTARGMIYMFRVGWVMYTSPVYRVPAIFVGVFSGLALFHYERKHNKRREPVRAQVVLPAETLAKEGREEREPPPSSSSTLTGEQLATVEEVAGDPDVPGQGGEKEAPGWPRWFRGFATQQAVIYLIVSFVFALCSKEFRDYTSDETKSTVVRYFFLYAHLNFSLIIAIIFLRMVTDWKTTWLMKVFSGRLFKSLAKLAYPIILIHWDILYYDTMKITQATLANKWQFGRLTTMTYMYIWPLSIAVHLILENPIDKLTKTYLLRARG